MNWLLLFLKMCQKEEEWLYLSFSQTSPPVRGFMQKAGDQIYMSLSYSNFPKTEETMQQLLGKGTLGLRRNCSLVLLKRNFCEV